MSVYDYWKNCSFDYTTFVSKLMSLLLNMLSRFVIAFLPRSKCLLISWLQSPSTVILELKKIKSVTGSIFSPVCHEVMGPDAMILVFWMLCFKPVFSLASFTLIKRLFISSLLSVIRVVSIICISEVIDISPTVLIPACVSSSPAFLTMCAAYKVNKQGDSIQPWCTPFPIWNQSIVPCLVLTVASWPAYRFLRRCKVAWYSHFFKDFPQFVVIHTIKGFSLVTEVPIFLEFFCFLYDPANVVGNLISGSSAFSKSSLYIWKCLVHVLLKPSWKDFEHYFASMWNECNCVVVWYILWHCLSLGLEWKLTFSSLLATAEFSKFAGILSSVLSQHHLLGFEIAQLEFHHLC